jgi:hypothetical protein
VFNTFESLNQSPNAVTLTGAQAKLATLPQSARDRLVDEGLLVPESTSRKAAF